MTRPSPGYAPKLLATWRVLFIAGNLPLYLTVTDRFTPIRWLVIALSLVVGGGLIYVGRLVGEDGDTVVERTRIPSLILLTVVPTVVVYYAWPRLTASAAGTVD